METYQRPGTMWGIVMRILASRILCCGCNRQIDTGLQKSCGEKGTTWPLSKWQRGREGQREPDPCLDRLLLLFWAHYIEVLIYYAQVHCRWLPFTDNKGQNTANYFKEKNVTVQGGKWLNWLHSILGWFSTDSRNLKILSKHLLPQSMVREF